MEPTSSQSIFEIPHGITLCVLFNKIKFFHLVCSTCCQNLSPEMMNFNEITSFLGKAVSLVTTINVPTLVGITALIETKAFLRALELLTCPF